MGFAEEIVKPISKKITLFEIDSPVLDLSWISAWGGVWKTTIIVTPDDDFLDKFGVTWYWNPHNDYDYRIGSIIVDGTALPRVASIAALEAALEGWYYDTTTTILYVRFPDSDPWYVFDQIVVGGIEGFSDIVDETSDGYYQDIEYQDRIISVPAISKKKDPLFFGVLSFQGGSVQLRNNDGGLDRFADIVIFNQPARIFLSFEGLTRAESEILYQGYVEDFAHDFTKLQLKIADNRKRISQPIPNSELADEIFGDNLAAEDVGRPIPIAYGVIKDAPVQVMNTGDVSPTHYYLKLCDTTDHVDGIKSIDAVYINEKSITFDQVDLSLARCRIAATDVPDENIEELSADFKGYVDGAGDLIENGLDIIADALEVYASVDFTVANYDLTEWNIERAGAYDCNLFIDEVSSIVDSVIQPICISNNGIFDVLADGRFTFRRVNVSRLPTHTIYRDELLDDPDFSYPSDEFLSTISIKYAPRYLFDKWSFEKNIDYRTDVLARYGRDQSKEFETALTNSADAAQLSTDIMERSEVILPVVTARTKTQFYDVKLLDTIRLDVGRNLAEKNLIFFEVIGISLAPVRYEIRFDLRYIGPTLSGIIDALTAEDLDLPIIDAGDSTDVYEAIDGGTAE